MKSGAPTVGGHGRHRRRHLAALVPSSVSSLTFLLVCACARWYDSRAMVAPQAAPASHRRAGLRYDGARGRHARAHAARPRGVAREDGGPRRAGRTAAGSQAGVTRRGFLVGGRPGGRACWSSAASRGGRRRGGTGSAPPATRLGVDIPGASGVTRRDYTLDSRYVGRTCRLQHRLAAGIGAGRPAPRLLRAARPRRRAADGLCGLRGGGGAEGRVAAVCRRRRRTAASRTGTAARPARTGSACCCRSWSRCAPAASSSAAAGEDAPSSAGPWAGTARCWRRRREPQLFDAVVAVSPAVWTSYDAMMLGPRDAFDDAADFAEHDVIAHADRLAGVDRAHRLRQAGPVLRLRDATLRPPCPSRRPAATAAAATTTTTGSRVAPAEARFIGRALRRSS